jgi:hypothetical protein
MLTEVINKSSAVPERTFMVATSMPAIDKLSRWTFRQTPQRIPKRREASPSAMSVVLIY